MTYLPIFAPSFCNLFIDTTNSASTLLASLLPLAQCTGSKIGDLFRKNISIIEDDLLDQSKELCSVEPYVKVAPIEEPYGDVMMGSATLELDLSTTFVPSYLT